MVEKTKINNYSTKYTSFYQLCTNTCVLREHHCCDFKHVGETIEKYTFSTDAVATTTTTLLIEVLHALAQRVVNDEANVRLVDSPAR